MAKEQDNRNARKTGRDGSPDRRGRWSWLMPVMLLIVVFVVFGPVVRFAFVDYDERSQILECPYAKGLSWHNITQIFTHFVITSYYPVRLLSFAIDHEFHGLNPGGYHATNLVIHMVSTLLLVWLGLRLLRCVSPVEYSSWRPWPAVTVGAGMFALHPVIVESVAWIAAREELLMVFFMLLAMHCHVSARSVRGRRRWLFHALAAICCACACMSNIVAVVTPAIVIAFDVTIARERHTLRLFVSTVVMWLIVGGALYVRGLGEAAEDRYMQARGVVAERSELTLAERTLTVIQTYALNWRTLLWPSKLTLRYPVAIPCGPLDPAVMAGALCIVLTLVAMLFLRRRPGMLFGLLWFLIAMTPSAQVVSHHITRADRFLYLPAAGLSLLVASALASASRKNGRFILAALLGAAIVSAWAVRSRIQLATWRNGETVFTQVLAVNPNDLDAHNNLAAGAVFDGRLSEALAHLEAARRIDPDDPHVLVNLGGAYRKLDRPADAMAAFRAALRGNPGSLSAENQIGELLLAEGRAEEALPHFVRATQLDAYYEPARRNLAAAHSILADRATKNGNHRKAAGHYRVALEAAPDWVPAINNLAWLLATSPDEGVRNGSEAVGLMEPVAAAAGDNAPLLDTLAAAYAEAGRFREAHETIQRAILIAERQGHLSLAESFREKEPLYRAGRPYRTTK